MTALLNRAALLAVAAAALLLLFALFVWLIVVRLDTMVDDAARAATKSRDAHWTAEIERGNAQTNKQIAEQLKVALAIETAANARVRAIESQLAELEAANAALPDGDACGLGHDRVRLLPR